MIIYLSGISQNKKTYVSLCILLKTPKEGRGKSTKIEQCQLHDDDDVVKKKKNR